VSEDTVMLYAVSSVKLFNFPDYGPIEHLRTLLSIILYSLNAWLSSSNTHHGLSRRE
jgi:hypothetical protein